MVPVVFQNLALEGYTEFVWMKKAVLFYGDVYCIPLVFNAFCGDVDFFGKSSFLVMMLIISSSPRSQT